MNNFVAYGIIIIVEVCWCSKIINELPISKSRQFVIFNQVVKHSVPIWIISTFAVIKLYPLAFIKL